MKKSVQTLLEARADRMNTGHGNVLAAQCPSREILRHVTSQWGTLILLVLRNGTCRFTELRSAVGGVSDRMLAETLKKLERDGFVPRRSYPVVPPHTEYSLTPLGREAAARVQELTDWIETNLSSITRQWPDAVKD